MTAFLLPSSRRFQYVTLQRVSQSELIIFKSLLTTFEESIIFWGSWGSSNSWLESNQTTMTKLNQVKLVQIYNTHCTSFALPNGIVELQLFTQLSKVFGQPCRLALVMTIGLNLYNVSFQERKSLHSCSWSFFALIKVYFFQKNWKRKNSLNFLFWLLVHDGERFG